jgi:hypothetical protein
MSQVQSPRAQEKQASRLLDARDLASGAKDADQLRAENSLVRPQGVAINLAAWHPKFR